MCSRCQQKCRASCADKQRRAGSHCTYTQRFALHGNNNNLFGHGRSKYGSECGFGAGTQSRYYQGDFGYGCVSGTGCHRIDCYTNNLFDTDKYFTKGRRRNFFTS